MTDSASVPLDDPRPMVARPISNRGIWLFGGAATLGAVLLFSALEARRVDRTDKELVPVAAADGTMIEPPPPLAIPDAVPADAATMPIYALRPLPVPRSVPVPASYPRYLGPQRGPVPAAPIYQQPPMPRYAAPVSPQPNYGEPVINAPQPDADARGALGRIRAVRFSNPATTVPQGSIIQAVLETALDSNRDGSARAIVSRDVRGFDGTKVLIPRGSRLYGEYKSDLAAGQNRALIQWTRLMRPDGVVIPLDSPSADPLGRVGIKGKVNSHFLSQFGNALLQTTLNIGAGLATRNVGGGGAVILGLPGSMQNITTQNDTPKRTLTVAQGAPLSVFVAHDLDFTEVER
jgi:type IV secretion system protein VirB10